MHNARQAFIDRLQHEVVTVGRATRALTPAIYQYFVGSSPQVRRNRIQAIKLFPCCIRA
jgi:hypothetical protein